MSSPFDEMARRAADSLDRMLMAELLGVDASTTVAQAKTPSLTYEELLEAKRKVERLKPSFVYYHAFEDTPKFNKDGGKFIARVRLGDDDVFFFHPDWLPFIKSRLGQYAWLLRKFDMERYALEWMDEELQRPRPVRTGGFATYVGRLGIKWRRRDG